MNELKVFENSEFGSLDVLLIDSREYFPATACAKILGYSNAQEAIRTHCKGVRKTLTPSVGGKQQVNYIPEGDLYRLIIRSKLPAAERFERWVFEEVLPSIREHGAYVTAGQLTDIIQQTASAVMSEVLSQIIPVLSNAATQSLGKQWEQSVSPRQTLPRKRAPGIIAKLDLDVRLAVEDMLYSGQYTYLDIVEHLAQYDVKISIAALHRYAKRMFAASNEL